MEAESESDPLTIDSVEILAINRSPATHQMDECELHLSSDKDVCILCRRSLYGKRTHSLPEGPERSLISDRISPREIPDGGLVCYVCWRRIRSCLQQQGTINPPTVDLNACVWCLRSLSCRRRHALPEGPERNEIIARIYPREIPAGGRVCYACWVSACRNVQKAQNVEERRQETAPSYSHRGVDCAWCGISLFRRRTRVLSSGPERDEVAARIYPNELPEKALVCEKCWKRVQENVLILQENVLGEADPPNPAMSLDNFKHTSNSSAYCFVPHCMRSERYKVPLYLRRKILKTAKVFVTASARVCEEHKVLCDWEFLEKHEFSNSFTKSEIESMLNLSLQEN